MVHIIQDQIYQIIETIDKMHYMMSSKHQDKFIENIQNNLSKNIYMILNYPYIAALENSKWAEKR
jgi:hypothetical protein